MTSAVETVGFIGLGDQGLPMATAIADGGYDLHVWARRAESLRALGSTPHVAHASAAELAGACDAVALCVSTDEAVVHLVGNMLPHLRPGTIVINHGTGTPQNAAQLAEFCADRGVESLDAPVSGGRPGAERRALTVLVGGARPTVERAEPVFGCFARQVFHLGGPGSGQSAKLFNNALLMMNQAAIADILGLATGLDPMHLVDALESGSGASAALALLNSMITPDTVGHLSKVQALDLEIFEKAMRESGADAVAVADVTARALSGTQRLAGVIARLNPGGHRDER